LWLPAQQGSTQTNTFAHPEIAREAQRYEKELVTKAAAASRPQQDLIAYGKRVLNAGDARAAAGAFAQAAVLAPENAETWLLLARALLATTPDPNRPDERYELPANASAAAYLAYQRATSPAVEAQALAVLGHALQRRSFWRPAIDAFRNSLSLADDPEVRQTYEALRSEHGFRLTDYTVEQDAAEPRVCLEFSEDLQRGQDFAKFVAVDGKDAQALVAEGRQLCVQGLAHGQRYQVLVRAGLPSDVEETLEKPAELAIYVRDRSPFV